MKGRQNLFSGVSEIPGGEGISRLTVVAVVHSSSVWHAERLRRPPSHCFYGKTALLVCHMKKLFTIFYVLVSVCVASAESLPDVKIENQKGEMISPKSLLKGKPLVILFWSTTCKPCIMELKAINEQLEAWREEVDFEVMAVSIDDIRSCSKAKAMANGYGWDFTCLFDKNQEFKRAMNVSLIPQSYVIDTEGEVVWSHSGYTPGSEQTLLEKIKELQKK